ncbi:MAG: hypothetical protein ACOX20_12495 [Limnochordia bacterium]
MDSDFQELVKGAIVVERQVVACSQGDNAAVQLFEGITSYTR